MNNEAKPGDHPLASITRKPDASRFNTGNAIQSPEIDHSMSDRGIAAAPTLSPGTLQVPALLVNHKLQVVWQNKAAVNDIWHDPLMDSKKYPISSIIELLFADTFQNKVSNWRQWLRFFMQHALELMPAENLKTLIGQQKERYKGHILDIFEDLTPSFGRNIFSGRIRQIHAEGTIATYWVVSTDFAEGRLFVFDAAASADAETGFARAAEVEQKLEMLRRIRPAASMPVHTMCLHLHDAESLRIETLVEDYRRLLDRLWQRSIETIENYGGIVANAAGADIQVYFVTNRRSEDNPLHIIECALALKSQALEVSREWKIRKGWLRDMELNIGLHSGDDVMGTIRSSLGDHIASFGNTLAVAAVLSEIAQYGQIWASKGLINRLPSKAREQLRFGVFRADKHRQVFIAKCFQRMADLAAKIQPPLVIDSEMGTLAATQIFDR